MIKRDRLRPLVAQALQSAAAAADLRAQVWETFETTPGWNPGGAANIDNPACFCLVEQTLQKPISVLDGDAFRVGVMLDRLLLDRLDIYSPFTIEN